MQNYQRTLNPKKKKIDLVLEESPVEYKAVDKKEVITEKVIPKLEKVEEEIPPPQRQESLQEKWSRFVTHETLLGSDISMVKEVSDVEFGDNSITLTTHVQFIYDNLNSHKRELQSTFTDLTNSKAEIKLVKIFKEEAEIEEREKHPIEQKIISEFKAFEEKSQD